MTDLITLPQTKPLLADARQQLTDKQKYIADTHLDNPRMSLTEIADVIGVSKQWVAKVMSKQHVREYIVANVHTSLLASASEAMLTQRSLLSSKSDYIRHQATSDILDRNDIGSSNEIRTQTVQVKIDLS